MCLQVLLFQFSTHQALFSHRSACTVRGEMCGFPLTRGADRRARPPTPVVRLYTLRRVFCSPLPSSAAAQLRYRVPPVKRVTRSPQRNLTHNARTHKHNVLPTLPLFAARLYIYTRLHTRTYIIIIIVCMYKIRKQSSSPASRPPGHVGTKVPLLRYWHIASHYSSRRAVVLLSTAPSPTSSSYVLSRPR